MNDDSPHYSLLVHGDPKIGKTELAATADAPVLFILAETGGTRHLLQPQIVWKSGPPPEASDDWQICRVDVRTKAASDAVLQWLASGQHPFASVVVDSLTELQRRWLREITGGSTPQIADWGTIADMTTHYVTTLADIVDSQDQLKALVVICASELRDGKMKPSLKGSTKDLVGYWLEMVGYMTSQPDEEKRMRRQLILGLTPVAETGNRWARVLPDVLWDPDLQNCTKATRRK